MNNSGKQGILIQEEVLRKCRTYPRALAVGFPALFNESYLWLSSGVIVQSSDQERRMVIMDCDNIDPFFRKIEEIVGKSIEPTVIETKMKATRDYLNSIISEDLKEKVRNGEMDIAPVVELINTNAHLMGYGDSRLVDLRLEFDDDDFLVQQGQGPLFHPADHRRSRRSLRSSDLARPGRQLPGGLPRPLRGQGMAVLRTQEDADEAGSESPSPRKAALSWRNARNAEAPRPFPLTTGTWKKAR